ncbi:hypothetical protein BHE74_00003126 [Ensete ventricosum]|nr:hypothetical protein BHE74_00003126 [Ensete ventricosum]
MERHDLALASARVHVFDLCLRKALCSALCSIFYVDSLHATWALHQVHLSCSVPRYALSLW